MLENLTKKNVPEMNYRCDDNLKQRAYFVQKQNISRFKCSVKEFAATVALCSL